MSFSWLRLLLILLPTAGLAASSIAQGPLPQDAYVWQRQWTPAVASALEQSADLVRDWRVLAAETDGEGRLRATAPDWSELASTRRSIIAVIRIDGQLARWDEDRLLADTRDLVARWREASVALAGIEIDHDCATARLPAYARFLTKLRAELGSTPLSITALPTWLGSHELDRVLAATDEVVLQVHAIQDPHVGLFDDKTARRWIEAFGRRTSKPFRVALPAYGTRVSWTADGRLRAVESERPLLIDARAAVELMASPREAASLLRDLERARPATLAGIVWFRLPTDGDSRAWSLSTWRAVVHGETLQATGVQAQLAVGAQPGLSDIRLINDDDDDAELPHRVALPAGCGLADGINGYALAQENGGPVLERRQAGLLHGHHQQTIGWMRCTAGLGDIHVQP